MTPPPTTRYDYKVIATPTKGLIIMTRTYIIAADGTRFIPETAAKRRTLRTIGIILAVFALPFIAAAWVGIGQAVTQGTPHTKVETVASVTAPKKEKGIDYRDAQKGCAKAPKSMRQACITLFMRSDWHDYQSYTPKGSALVKDCLSQYRGIELRYCFNQEV